MQNSFMKKKSCEIYLHMICTILVLVGALNWGLIGVLNMNLVKLINENTFNSPVFESTVYILVGIAALYIGFNRNTYLPFLGDTVLAPSLIKDTGVTRENANIEVEVDGEGASTVMYWAANPAEAGHDGEKFAFDAYANFENAGVAPVVNGKAKLRVECPQKYWVKKYGFIKQTIPRHLHYRLIYPTGWTSEVLTKKLNCESN